MSKNIDQIYLELLQDILENGHKKPSRTGINTISTFGQTIKYDMRLGFPMCTTKKLHTKSIIHELLWFLGGNTNIQYLTDNGVTIWNEWADKDGNLGPVYGKQWVNWGGTTEVEISKNKDEYGYLTFKEVHHKGINQIQNIIERLKTTPDCRRLIVSAWNVADLPNMKLMPCHYGFQIYTRELSRDERIKLYLKEYEPMNGGNESSFIDSKLKTRNIPEREISLMWNQRSIDTFLGLPFNIASYGFLLEMFAQQANMVPGKLIGCLGDTHIYDNHIDYVKKQLDRDATKYSVPKLVLNKADSLFDYKFDDFKIEGYESYPNWKNVPIAI